MTTLAAGDDGLLGLFVVLLIFLTLVATIVFAMISLSRHLREHEDRTACRDCGYDLHASLSARCPECGTAVTTIPDNSSTGAGSTCGAASLPSSA